MRKRIEETIRQSEDKFATAFDNIPLMMAISRLEDGTYLDVNKKFCELTGYRRDEIIDKKSPDLGIMSPEDRQRLLQELQQLGHISGVESRLSTKAGKQITAVLYGEFITIDNNRRLLSIALDVTEHRQLEQQLRQSQKMEAVGQLAGGVAHDFNNILSVIMGYAHMLKMGPGLNLQHMEKIDHIIAASEKAAQLTSGLLAFSRKQVLTLHTVNLNDIVLHLEKFLVRVIGEDIHLQSIVHQVELPVNVDSSQIEQALINLATNARDAMPQGGLLIIETGLQEVDASFAHALGYGRAGSYAVITVTDNGTGMNEETRKKIFEPFFTTKETGKGTGLGLAIVYGIIKQHNGFINFSSEPGKGTVFRIYLPLMEKKGLPVEEQSAPDPPKGGGETILVAEDDPAVRKLVAAVLTEYGYDVILAEDGREAVAQFSANRERIRLILMDMIMPGQSGKAAADEIRKLYPQTRILFTSGYTADFIKSRGVVEQGEELIMKPVQPLELLRRVREMLDR